MRKLLIGVAISAGSLASAAVGYLANDFFDFRNKQIESARAAYDQTADAASELDAILQKFFQFAEGRGTATQSDKDNLAAAINKAYVKADLALKQMPSLKPQFDEYADALVQLKRAADNITGPLGAKPFVVAVDRYLVAEGNFKQAAADIQRSYIRSFSRYIY